MFAGDGVKRVKSREFTGISPHQLAGTGVKLVKTRVVFVAQEAYYAKCIHSVLLMDDDLEKYNCTVLLTSIHADINSLTNLNILGCCE